MQRPSLVVVENTAHGSTVIKHDLSLLRGARIDLLRSCLLRTALVRASHAPVEVVALSKEVFLNIIHASKETLSELADVITLRTDHLSLALESN